MFSLLLNFSFNILGGDTARKLLMMGFPLSQIMEITGLSLDQVNGLKDKSSQKNKK